MAAAATASSELLNEHLSPENKAARAAKEAEKDQQTKDFQLKLVQGLPTAEEKASEQGMTLFTAL